MERERKRDVLPVPKSHLGYPEKFETELKTGKSGLEGEGGFTGLCREWGRKRKQQKASRHPEETLSISHGTFWALNLSCWAFISWCVLESWLSAAL